MLVPHYGFIAQCDAFDSDFGAGNKQNIPGTSIVISACFQPWVMIPYFIMSIDHARTRNGNVPRIFSIYQGRIPVAIMIGTIAWV